MQVDVTRRMTQSKELGQGLLSSTLLWQIVTATPFEHRPRLLDRAEGPRHAPTRQRPQQGTERT